MSTAAMAVFLLISFAAYAQPANDACANAITLTCGQTVSGTTIGSTDDAADGAVTCSTIYNGGQGVWYYFAGNNNLVTLTTCDQADYDTKISVFSGACGSLTCVDGNDDDGSCTGNTSTVSFVANSGTDYYILVHGFGGATGNFDLTISCTPPPSNDDCSSATPVACGDVVSGNTVLASGDTSLNDCTDDLSTAPGVWYSFVGTGNGVTFSLCSDNTDFDTKMGVFSGSCGALVCEATNDDECGLASEVTLCSTVSAQTYYIYVTGFSTNTGNFELFVACDDGNDDCANATALPTVYQGLYTNLCATTDGPDEPTGCTFFSYSQLDNDVWYSITPESSCDVTVSLCGSGYDTKMAIYDATSGCPSTESALFCNDDDCSLQSEITFTPTAGTTYLIRIAGFGGDQGVGILDISIDDNASPVIVNCPADITQSADAGVCDAAVTVPVPVFGVDFTDDCFATIENDYNNTADASDTYPLGTTTVTWTATDLVGNTVTCTQTITITDDEGPVMDCNSGLQLFDNGPLSSSSGTGVGGADESVLENVTLGMTTLGQGHQVAFANRIADDFTIDNPNGWTIDEIVFYAYQTGSPTTSTITGLNLRIWDSIPGLGSIVWGDTTTNILTNTEWSGVYRVTEPDAGISAARPIMANTANLGGVTLPPGTYWLDWQTDGSLASGPWAPPIVITGQTTTGNGLQRLSNSGGVYNDAVDGGTGAQMGFPFQIIGSATLDFDNGTGTCDATVTLPSPVPTDCNGVTSLVNDFNNTDDASDTYPVGTTTVTWTATDGLGNMSTCSYDVVVNDTTAPSIDCTTSIPTCNTTASSDVGQGIDNPLGSNLLVESTLDITTPAIITDINVPVLDITHTWVGDLDIELESPSGTIVTLVNDPCDFTGSTGLLMGFDDSGLANGSYPCDPNDGLLYVPDSPLSAFNGENAQGTWTLRIVDDFGSLDGGTLNAWSLEVCTGGDNTVLAIADPGVCETTVSVPAPAFSDNCTGATIENDYNNTNDASDTYPVGTTTVTWTVTDVGGNTNTCTMEITVIDDEDPVVTCPGDTTVGNDAGMCDAVVSFTAPTVSDNCPLPPIQNFQLSGPTAIPDGDTSGISIPFTVSGISATALGTDAYIESVCLDISHTWVGDLIVRITSPNGTSVDLMNRPGVPAGSFGCGGDDVDACFETGTGNDVENVCSNLPAIGGTFTAMSDLAALDDGSDPNGSWTLFISDNAGFDTGELNSLTLNFNVPGAPPSATQIAGLTSGSVFPVGVTTNTFVITDASGNTDTCSFNVTVNDTEAPVVNCPSDTTVSNELGTCDAVVTYPFPTATDNCAPTQLTQSLNQTNIVTFNSVSCNAGGLHTDNAYLRVYDLPALGYNNDFFVESVTFGVETATAGSGGSQPATVNLYTLSGPLAYANLTLIATQATTIPDTSSALLTVPVSVTVPAGSILVVELFTPEGQTDGSSFFIGSNTDGQTGTSYIAAGDCGFSEPTDLAVIGFPSMHILLDVTANVLVEQIGGLGSGSTFPVGTNTETFMVTDLHGNMDTCSFNVIVVDTMVPVVSCPTSPLVCDSVGSTDVGQSIDVGPGTETITSTLSISGLSGVINDVDVPVLDITHTWVGDLDITLTSPSGTVVNLISDPCDFTSSSGLSMGFDDSGLTNGTYPCDPNDGLLYQPDSPLSAFNSEDPNGVWTLTIADDFTGLDAGVLNAWSLNVCVGGDNVFVFNNDSSNCDATVSLDSATGTDNCPGLIITNSFNGTGDASDTYPVGTTVVEWYATDSAGNADTCEIIVIVNDVEPPIIVCPNDTTVSNDSTVCGAVVNYSLPTYTDNCPFPSTVNVGYSGSPVSIPDGDSNGTTADVSTSGLPSTLGTNVFLESVCLDIDHTWVGDLIVTITSPNGTSVTLIDQPGVPASTFGCSGDNVDACFLPGTGADVENVCSNAPALGGNFTAMTDLGALNDGSDPNGAWTIFVSDNQGFDTGVLNGFDLTFSTPGSVPPPTLIAGLAPGSTFPVGVTTNTYVATDVAGNTDTCSFNITVTDNEAPTWACISDTTVDQQIDGVCFAIVDWVPPVPSDNCAVDSVYSTHAPGDFFPVGVTPVTYTAVDEAGNSSTCTFNVIVLDVEDPVITGCPADITASSDANSCGNTVSWTQPTASDNCTGVTLTATHIPGDYFPIGVTTVMYVATDSAGNTDTCTFDITVVDDVAPTIVCPDDIVVCSDDTSGAVVTYLAPTTADNCMVDTVQLTAGLESGMVFPIGTTTVTYEVTDTAGNATTCSFDVTVNPTPVFDATVVDVDCNGNGNGSITVNATFGTAPFTYSLDGGTPQVSNVFDNLDGGSYIVTVTGDDGCSASDTIMVVEPEVLAVDVDFEIVLCFGDTTGSITVMATGGTTPYEYSNDGGTNYQSGNTFGGLGAGLYNVRVKDANGCIVDVAVDITEPASAVSATADVADVACFGDSSGTITVNATGGTGAYQYSVDGGSTYQGSPVFSGLASGTYSIMVMDANGCTVSLSDSVGGPASALVIDALNLTPTNCNGDSSGVVTVAASGGTPGYTYSVDGVNFQTGASFNGLAAGTYLVTVMDDNGCTVTDTADVNEPDPLAFDVTATTEPDCEGQTTGSITVAGSGGTTPYQYSINGGSFQSSGTFDNLTSGTYTIVVMDEKGCTYEEVITLNAGAPLPVASFSTVTAGGSVSFVNASSNASSYSWNFDDGNTSSDVNPVNVYTESGVYTVVLIATNSCGSDTAIMTLIIDVTSIDEVDGGSLNIYPNPTPGDFTVDYQATDNIGDFQIRVVTIDGKLVFTESKDIAGQSYIKRFDRGLFSNGVYVIEIITEKAVHHQRLIIEK